MKKILHSLFAFTLICCNFAHSMENPAKIDLIQEDPWFSNELIVRIAGYCMPTQKNILMKLSKDCNALLKDRELILQANPHTVSKCDKLKAMFVYTCQGDAKKLNTWLFYIKQAGIDVDYKNILGMTALHMAHDNPEIMPLLVKYGANTTISKPEVPALHEAVYRNNLEFVNALLACQTDPNITIAGRITPLFIAAREGHAEIVTLLINAHANVNQANSNENTPLFIAAQEGHTEVVIQLINAHANVNPTHNDKVTPLCFAAQNGHTEIVTQLINAHANVNPTHKDGVTPLFLAAQNGHTKIVTQLITGKADIHQAINAGITPLYIAAKNGHTEIVSFLLAAGAEANGKKIYVPTK